MPVLEAVLASVLSVTGHANGAFDTDGNAPFSLVRLLMGSPNSRYGMQCNLLKVKSDLQFVGVLIAMDSPFPIRKREWLIAKRRKWKGIRQNT